MTALKKRRKRRGKESDGEEEHPRQKERGNIGVPKWVKDQLYTKFQKHFR